MLRLIMKIDGDQDRVFTMADEQMTIGRGNGCDLRIPLPQISDEHCRIFDRPTPLGSETILECLDEEIETNLNGVRIRRAVLADEDVVQIGPVVFHVAISHAAGETTFEIVRENDTIA